MSLGSIQLEGVRCLSPAELDFAPRLNVIHGANGSGKTSLLEAIFLAGRGRSFRTRNTEQLISRGQDALRVFARTQNPDHRIGFEYRREEAYTARLDGQDVQSLAELPVAFFVEVIDPEVHRLVEGGPSERRRWLDWGVFHVEPQFLHHWVRFSRALRQRNAALRSGQDPKPWDVEFLTHGQAVSEMRAQWFEALREPCLQTARRLSGLPLELAYQRGWSQDKDLGQALAEGLERDRTRGNTLLGPQRSDVALRMGGKPARESLSRGQQKLVAAAMVLALLKCLRSRQPTRPTLLLDDPAAELDDSRLTTLVDLVAELDCQLIITSLRPDLGIFGSPERAFHVEQGAIQGL